MAFQNKNIAVIAYANGFTIWHYKTTDSIIDIEKNNTYFPKQMCDLFKTGDMIIITSGFDCYMRCIKSINDNKVSLSKLG